VTIGMPGVTKTSQFRTGVPVVLAEELEVLAGSASVGDPLRFSIRAYFTLKIVSGILVAQQKLFFARRDQRALLIALLHERCSALADFLKRRFEAPELLRA
jgi:hypothetical protein